MSDTFRLYAVRYARRDAVRAEHFYGFDPCGSAAMPMDYFIWVAVGDNDVVVIDAGFTPPTAEQRRRQHLASPVDTLARLGVDADAVHAVVVTHLHYDHTGYLPAFTSARLLVQESEMSFWTGRHAGRGEFRRLCTPDDVAFLVGANIAGRVRLVDGDATVVPGVTAHLVGGHTPGLQVVRVRTDSGHAVIASDASHYYANIDEDRPFSIVHTLPAMYDAFDRVRELADSERLVVAGHDPLVMKRFAPAAPGLAHLAVRVG